MQICIVHISDTGEVINKKAIANFFKLMKEGKGMLTYRSLKKRSINTNSFMHVIFTMLVEPLRDAGWENIRTMDDAKWFVKKLFLTVIERNEKTGEEIEMIRHTSELNQEEANIFIDDIYRWAAEYLSFVIPEPLKQIQMFNQPVLAQYDENLQVTIVN